MGDLETNVKKLRALSNRAKYGEAYRIAKGLRRKFPDEGVYAYYEAVMFGDDEAGRKPAEIQKRHARAAKLIFRWLSRLRNLDPLMRGLFRNEYYWFSHQPKKQYRLGVERVKNGFLRSYYSQGVGATEVARLYFAEGKDAMGMRWSKKAEMAWNNFFKIEKNWYNSYCWFAKSLGYQGKVRQMERALNQAARISKRKQNHKEFQLVRRDIARCLALSQKRA